MAQPKVHLKMGFLFNGEPIFNPYCGYGHAAHAICTPDITRVTCGGCKNKIARMLRDLNHIYRGLSIRYQDHMRGLRHASTS